MVLYWNECNYLLIIKKAFCKKYFQFVDFISKNDGEHIRGTECDQRIFSKKESNGFVYSPNYPFPYMPKLVCRYFIYGMQNAQYLERVRLEFVMFEIPKGNKGEWVSHRIILTNK